MRTIARTWMISLALALASGCIPNGGGGRSCTVGGKVYKSGERFPSPDGCNTCQCVDGTAACTEIACVPDMAIAGGDGMSMGGDGMAAGDLGGAEVMCAVAMNPTFPTFSKACRGDGECAIGVHQINCCGSQKAIGMNRGEVPRFEAAEKLCRSQYPRCGCPTLPTVAEDGRSEIQGSILVRCDAGACMTYVK
jgi:hypothetical protein